MLILKKIGYYILCVVIYVILYSILILIFSMTIEKLTDSSILIAIIMLPFILIVNPIVSINISKKLLDL